MFRTLRTILPIQLLPLFLLFGCFASEGELDKFDAATDEEVASETYAVTVDVDPESFEPTIMLPDGSITHSFDEYAEVVAQIYETTPAAEFVISFGQTLENRIAMDIGEDVERWGTSVGSYYVHTGFHYGYVGGCVRQTRNHLDLHINQGSAQKMALHMLAYANGGRVCLGAYESVSQFCVNICTPTYTQVRDTIIGAAMAIGISYSIAYVIASVATPVAIGALAL